MKVESDSCDKDVYFFVTLFIGILAGIGFGVGTNSLGIGVGSMIITFMITDVSISLARIAKALEK